VYSLCHRQSIHLNDEIYPNTKTSRSIQDKVTSVHAIDNKTTIESTDLCDEFIRIHSCIEKKIDIIVDNRFRKRIIEKARSIFIF
jgi:hypothetical protein